MYTHVAIAVAISPVSRFEGLFTGLLCMRHLLAGPLLEKRPCCLVHTEKTRLMRPVETKKTLKNIYGYIYICLHVLMVACSAKVLDQIS